MKVKLLKPVGDHPKDTELEIEDVTVLKAWSEKGVIEKLEGLEYDEDTKVDISPVYSAMKVDELKAIAEENQLPKEDWASLKKDDLVKYLTKNIKD